MEGLWNLKPMTRLLSFGVGFSQCCYMNLVFSNPPLSIISTWRPALLHRHPALLHGHYHYPESTTWYMYQLHRCHHLHKCLFRHKKYQFLRQQHHLHQRLWCQCKNHCKQTLWRFWCQCKNHCKQTLWKYHCQHWKYQSPLPKRQTMSGLFHDPNENKHLHLQNRCLTR
jgi:hypothetical protein